MAIPALPSANLILVQTAFAFGRLEADLDFPPAARDVDERMSRRLPARGAHHVVGALTLLVKTAPDQKVMPESTFLRCNLQAPERSQCPVIQTLAFGARARRQALPSTSRQVLRGPVRTNVGRHRHHNGSFYATASTKGCSRDSSHSRACRSPPYTSSPVTQPHGTPAFSARSSICKAAGSLTGHRSPRISAGSR